MHKKSRGEGTIIGSFGHQLAGVDALLQSATCKASSSLNISGIHLPTFIGYTKIALTIPLSSIINTFLTVSVLLISFEIIPYFLAMLPFLSAIIGKGIRIPVLQYISYIQARCEAILILPIRSYILEVGTLFLFLCTFEKVPII